MSALDFVSIPKSIGEAMTDPNWHQEMVEEMDALHSNSTWDIVTLPPDTTIVGCRWVYTVKFGPDGQIDHFKSRLVAKGLVKSVSFLQWLLFIIDRFISWTLIIPFYTENYSIKFIWIIL